jgi:predicted metal-dependent hydrolase
MAYSPSQPRAADGKFSGALTDSLEHQLRAKGHNAERAHELAIEIMVAQGTRDASTGQLTAKGLEREAMGRVGRRIDRVATQTGHKPEHIAYKNGRAYVK